MRVKPVVNSILKLGFRNETQDLTHLKIQKLLYFLNGWYLAIHGEPVIDEPFEAWPYGPVVPSLYSDLKRYGASPIDEYLLEWDENSLQKKPFVISKENKDFWEVLNPVWEKYSVFSAKQLSTMSHETNSPWDRTPQMLKISNSLTRNYFLALSKNREPVVIA